MNVVPKPKNPGPKQHIGFGSGPHPCVSVSGPTPAMESARILRVEKKHIYLHLYIPLHI